MICERENGRVEIDNLLVGDILNSMAFVRSFGNGYYALETEGVTVSPEAETRITNAFKLAMAIPDADIRVQLRNTESSSQAPAIFNPRPAKSS